MKRFLVTVLLTIAVIGIFSFTTPSAATQPTADGDYCDTADDTCRGLQLDAVENCRANGGLDCFCAGVRAFNACMTQFGCSGYTEQQMIERGCGPQ